ncbi:MAG TPA: DUF362 domain-containing protein [Desulfopila sp.]|nr:DUF362 domain-containing protein [Desulfopila sp.]
MDRRRFLQKAMVLTAGAGMPVPLINITEALAGAPAPEVSVVTGVPYEAVVRRALSMLGGMGAFVGEGDRVVIKPNIGWDRSPELGANTHPLVVRALAEMALEAGAAEVKVFDRTCNERRRCYVNSGIQSALEEMDDGRVRLEHIDDRKFVDVDIKSGKSLKRWQIYKDALDADCYINVPVAKNHGLSRLTLGLKNSMGVIGGNRGSLHFDIGQKLADLATVLQPTLTVVDATRMLLANGPQGGRLSDVKVADTIIATRDPVAADALATTLFGLRPEDIGSTVAAFSMGLGEMNVDAMRIKKGRV